jgi:hypothetical protein
LGELSDGENPNPFAGLIPPLQELRISVEPGRAPRLIAALDAALNSGWQRARDLEEKSAVSHRPRLTCYRCDERGERPSAAISLFRWNSTFFQGVCVARAFEELTHPQQNRVLVDFHDNVLSKIPPESCLGFAIGPYDDRPKA